MRKLRCFTVCIVLLSALILTACGWAPEDNAGNFEYRLQGRWETTDYNDEIYIILTITSNTITIEDNSQWWVNKDDPTHPFKDFDKGTLLKGYSKKIDNYNGIIYIEEFGVLRDGIPYKYELVRDSSSYDSRERLSFTFPIDPEAENHEHTSLKKLIE